MLKRTSMLVVALFGSAQLCVSAPVVAGTVSGLTQVPGPVWTSGVRAFDRTRGRALYGVGVATGIRNAAMRGAAARTRARTELAEALRRYLSALTRKVFPGAEPTSALVAVEQMVLSAVVIADSFVEGDGSERALARLDLLAFGEALRKIKELPLATVDALLEKAPEVFDELAAAP